MESELFNSKQIELMFKFQQFFDELPEEEQERIINTLNEGINETLTKDEYQILVDECNRLNEENEKRIQTEQYLQDSEEQLRNIIKSTYVHGFDVGETIIS